MSNRRNLIDDPDLKGVPGIRTLGMRYEDGGFVQVFFIGDKEWRLGPMASHAEVKAAILELE